MNSIEIEAARLGYDAAKGFPGCPLFYYCILRAVVILLLWHL